MKEKLEKSRLKLNSIHVVKFGYEQEALVAVDETTNSGGVYFLWKMIVLLAILEQLVVRWNWLCSGCK